ncbi:RloB family protein [Kribbella sp. NPDC055071]
MRTPSAIAVRSADEFDEVWCVFDVDDFDIEPATREARRAGLELAVSDPCFELWLLLHHEDCRAFQNGYKDVVRSLQKHVGGYDKTKLAFADYAGGVTAATVRAEKLGESGNPSTGMWRLATRSVMTRSLEPRVSCCWPLLRCLRQLLGRRRP